MKACLESPRETITKLTQTIKGFIRVAEYKLCTQKSIVSIYRKKQPIRVEWRRNPIYNSNKKDNILRNKFNNLNGLNPSSKRQVFSEWIKESLGTCGLEELPMYLKYKDIEGLKMQNGKKINHGVIILKKARLAISEKKLWGKELRRIKKEIS